MARRTHGRRLRPTVTDTTCRRCGLTIAAGTEHVVDVSGTPSHPSCRNLRVQPTSYRRAIPDDPARWNVTCDGCGDRVQPGEPTVHREGVAWHRACDLNDRRLAREFGRGG